MESRNVEVGLKKIEEEVSMETANMNSLQNINKKESPGKFKTQDIGP